MKTARLIILHITLFVYFAVNANCQVTDTIANWDGINVPWTAIGVSTQQVENPDPSGINTSANCMKATTSNGQYDLIYNDLSEPVNFNEWPLYRIKVLAPMSGGSIVFKFENSTNTNWTEIEKTPAPGQWDELEFDFTGVMATDYVRMVIFFDFLGTTAGQEWFLDDVIRISEGGAGLTSNLPIVIINTYGVPIPDEPKIDGEMKIIDYGPDSLNNQYDIPNGFDGFIGIEVRGQSAQMFLKKSYAFETRDSVGENLNVSLLGMPAENDWILYGPYSDKSMLRNFMAFYIGSLLDPYCSRIAYCEVIENNNYKGVYILMEKIKKDENRVNIATLKSEDISGDELTGGYILRVDKLDPDFAYGYHGWKSIPNPPYPNALNITYQYYYPKAEDIMPQQKSYITDYILNAENALTGNGFNNPNTGYNHFLNVGSFVDHMVLREISKEVDSYRYSTYFYKEKDSDGGKLFAGPPWDFNLGFANVDYYEPGVETSGWIFTEVEPWDAGRMFWWKRLMQDPYYENLFYTRWHQLRQDELTNENIELAIDSIVNYIGEAQQRNFSRWPILGQYVWPNYSWEGNNYDDEVALFEDWLMDRIYWLDSNIPGTMLSPSALLSGTFPELNISLTDDYFSREILKNKYFDLNISSDEVSLDTVIFEDASHAKLFFMGNPDPNTLLSVTIDKKVINTFSDLSTNEIALTGLESITANKFRIYASGKKIIIENTDQAEDDCQLKIFSITGQKIEGFRLTNKDVQYVETKAKQGVYVCTFQSDRIIYTCKIFISE